VTALAIVLAALLVALVAGMFLALATGRLWLDVGWGRSHHKLGPIEIQIGAPRELVFELLSAPYLGRVRAGPDLDVLERSGELAVAAHLTRVHFYTARTVEAVRFEPPSRVRFRHLTGPVPEAREEFVLEEENGITLLRYCGELGIDFFILGRVAGRHWVRPQWERVVGEHLEQLREHSERLAQQRVGR
jgi:hypothetical protein